MKYIKIIRWFNRFLLQNIKGSHHILPSFNSFFLRKIDKPIEVDTIYGFTVQILGTTNSVIEKAIYERGVYEAGTLHIIDLFLREDDKFIDVGANIGLMSLLAAQKVTSQGEVHAFEVSPNIFSELKYNLAQNNFSFVNCHFCALGSYRGKGELYENDFLKNRGTSTMLTIENSQEKKYEVPVDTLDNLFGKKKVDMIKIDVEGWELEVLKGGNIFFSLPDAPAIIIECSKDRVNKMDDRANIFRKIKEINSYRIFKLRGKKERQSKLIEIKSVSDLPIHDNIFCFLEEHLVRFKASDFDNFS